MYRFLSKFRQKSQLVDFCLFCIHDVGIPEDELMEMELFQVNWIVKLHNRRIEKEDSRFANLMCLLYNMNRGKNPSKTPQDFMPRKPKTQAEVEQDILKVFGVHLKR